MSILFSPEVPLDLFSSSVIVPVYDTEKNATTGEEVEIFLPYNAVERPWTVSPRDKLERWLYQKLSSEKYIIYIPEYKGERFSLLASREEDSSSSWVWKAKTREKCGLQGRIPLHIQ